MFNPYRRMTLIIVLIVLFFAAVSVACDDGPTGTGDICANACGITAPVTELEQAVIDAVDSDPSDNVLH